MTIRKIKSPPSPKGKRANPLETKDFYANVSVATGIRYGLNKIGINSF